MGVCDGGPRGFGSDVMKDQKVGTVFISRFQT